MKTLMLTDDQASALLEALQSFYDDQEGYIRERHYWSDFTEQDARENKASQLRTVAEACDLLDAPYLASQLNELANEAYAAEDEEPKELWSWSYLLEGE